MNAKRARTLKVIEKTTKELAETHRTPVTVLVEFLRADFLSVILELNTHPMDNSRLARIAVSHAQAYAERAMQSTNVEPYSPQITVVSGFFTSRDKLRDNEILEAIDRALRTLIPASKE